MEFKLEVRRHRVVRMSDENQGAESHTIHKSNTGKLSDRKDGKFCNCFNSSFLRAPAGPAEPRPSAGTYGRVLTAETIRGRAALKKAKHSSVFQPGFFSQSQLSLEK